MKINFCSAPPGSGKTHQVSNRSRNLAEGCNKVLILQPTRDLLEKTAEEEIRPFPFRIFHKGKVDGSVAKALADYVAEVPDDVQEVLLATHQVLPHIKNFANKDKSSSSGMIPATVERKIGGIKGKLRYYAIDVRALRRLASE